MVRGPTSNIPSARKSIVKVVEDPDVLASTTRKWQTNGQVVGLVPTMGALHAGHQSLIERARSMCDRVVVSIFVNPIQFSESSDFLGYPTPIDSDLDMCQTLGVDLVYRPDAKRMYPEGFSTSIHVARLTDAWEGRDRPGHFDGVATVVTKLLAASRADKAFFGQKDFQQCAVLRRLITDLDLDVEMVVCPTVRDHDGLAFSSRNERLSAESRRNALAIPTSLRSLQKHFDDGQTESATLCDSVVQALTDNDLVIHYVEIVDSTDLAPVGTAQVGNVVIVAASSGGVRLLDNHILT